MRLPINSMVGLLYASKIITFHELKEIQNLLPESRKVIFLLDNVLLPSLHVGMVDKYKAFVALLKKKGEDEDDAVLTKLSKDLGMLIKKRKLIAICLCLVALT